MRDLACSPRHALTQEQAAAKAGITHRQWQRWESGESIPYPRNLDAIARAFGVPVTVFFDELVDGLPEAEATQLDRLESKLDEILALLPKQARPPKSQAKPRRKRAQ